MGVLRKAGGAVVTLLMQGLTPEQIALAIAVAVTLGTFPVLGSTTLLCVAVSVCFGLNLPAMQLVNWLAYPLQLGMLVPLLRAGSKLVGSRVEIPSLTEIGARLSANLWGTVHDFWLATLGAILLWLIASPFSILLMYFLAVWPIRCVARRFLDESTR